MEKRLTFGGVIAQTLKASVEGRGPEEVIERAEAEGLPVSVTTGRGTFTTSAFDSAAESDPEDDFAGVVLEPRACAVDGEECESCQ